MATRAAGPLGVLLLAAVTASCASSGETQTGVDLFRVAVNGTPGGALLSVWGDPGAEQPIAYLAGGYVGVDPATVADGRVGRLLRYVYPGKFNTVCSADRPLWWVTGVRDGGDPGAAPTVFAAGEGGRVVRYDGASCTRIDVPADNGQDAPTIWGMYAAARDDVWMVGGSTAVNGPKGVLLHFDGVTYRQEAALPAAATGRNLYKIDRTPDGGLIVVGEAGVVLRRAPGGASWEPVPTDVRALDNRIFTVSCSTQCYAVGGAGQGLILRGDGSSMQTLTSLGSATLDDLPGLNGVYTPDGDNVFFVGVDGFTMHSNGVSVYRPDRALTNATLHGVGGVGVVLAVGGEIGVASTTQRGVILVRGDDSDFFLFDGRMYTAQGDLRRSVGGFGQ